MIKLFKIYLELIDLYITRSLCYRPESYDIFVAVNDKIKEIADKHPILNKIAKWTW